MGTEPNDGSDAAAAAAELRRQQQSEVLGAIDFSRQKLEHARFIASMTNFKQGRGGDIFIELMVPFEYREQAIGMLDASGVPLSVDVVEWKRGATHPRHDG